MEGTATPEYQAPETEKASKGEVIMLPADMRARRLQEEPRLEIRKLQKVGSSTLSVSLPSVWAAEQGLKRGASVQLVEDGKELRVIPVGEGVGAVPKETAYVIAADECRSSEVLSRVIVGGYVLGRDHLVVRSKARLTADAVEAVRRTSKKLIGMGIIEEGPSEITLQCSIETQRYPVDALFKRLYNLSSSAVVDSLEALRTKDRKLAQVAASREEDADMIYWLIMRLILSAQQDESVRTMIGLKSRADIAGYSIIANDLERIADQSRVIALNVEGLVESEAKLPGALHTALRAHGLELGQLFADAMLALLSRELDKAVEATEIASRLRKEEESLVLQTLGAVHDANAVLRVRRIIQAMVQIAESCRSIAIIAFSRHQSEPTRFMRPSEGEKPIRTT
jgi:phosphate uptake regulator